VVSATYGSPITGTALVAIVGRQATSGSIATIGQVTDGTNKWRQVNEASNLTTRGVDVWVCENPTLGGTPTVTAQLNLFPTGTLSQMNIFIMELGGTTGYEITDAFGVGAISGTTATISTNYATTAAHEYLLSAVTTNASAATVPSTWTSLLADTTQDLWIAGLADSGTGLAVQNAAWTGLTGSTSGCGVIVAFRQTGVSSSSPHLLQSSYYEPALTSTFSLTQTSQAYPINPATSSVLVAFVTGAVYEPPGGGSASRGSIYAGVVQAVTDTASGLWRKMGEAGLDNVGGGDWSYWYCGTPPGGATTLTARWDVPIQTPAVLLLELGGCSTTLVTDSQGAAVAQTIGSISTAGSVSASDIAFSTFGAIIARLFNPGSGWAVAMSDTNGVGFHQLNVGTASGVLTATVGASSAGTDMLISAFRPSKRIALD